jgi:hypothetical protein
MQAIGVLYGYGSRDELLAAGAQHLCAAPPAISECIFRNFLNPPASDSITGSAVNLS